MKFDVDRAASRAWEYCGRESFNKCSPEKQAKVMEKVRAGQDMHYIYKGQCVGVLRRTWAACGVNIQGMDSCHNPTNYMQLLLRNPNIYRQVGLAALNSPRYGDVVLYHGGETVGHGAIFLPIKGQGCWVSDAVQRGWDVYRSYAGTAKQAHDVLVFRFAGDVNGDGGNATFPDVGEGGGWMTMYGGAMDTRQALLDYCPENIEFKGLWMRYHLWMGDRSPIIRQAAQSGFYGGTSGAYSEFGGAGAGKLPIPPGFYSDAVLYNFISSAEGTIGIQWVGSNKGHDVVTSAACFGYDFPGGVHDPSYISKLGLTPSDTANLGITNRGRAPIGGESYGGKVRWGWYTQPLGADHPYWKKLIPYYRDAMIWAWNQPIIQNVKDPGERLARMHSINWWGYHYLKGFHGGKGWPHRLQCAKKACAGMAPFP